MIFMAGPRQSGKTTLSRMIAGQFSNHLYFNYDVFENKKKIITNPTFFEDVNRSDETTPLIVLDEIHKYKEWKNYLKGIYDQFNNEYKFLISGSGRLDIYKKGGDSLAGRYLLFYLWPFTLSELANQRHEFNDFLENPLEISSANDEAADIWKNLKALTGFPEPFVKGEEAFYRIWSNTYHRQLLREDIRNAFQVRQSDTLEILFSLLPERTGSLLSMNNLADTIHVSFDTVKNWMHILDRFFMTFSISPWSKNISRAIRKEKKVYLFDYGMIKNESARFENMVALELMRAVSVWNNQGLGNFQLHFIRNKEKEEVDFLIVNSDNPFLLIECKLNDDNISKTILKFQNQLNIPAVQLVDKESVCRLKKKGLNKILVVSASRWLSVLP